MRRECNADRCPSRKCNEHAFRVSSFEVKPHLLLIDVLFFKLYSECAAPHRVGSAGQAKQALNASTARHRISCQAA